MKQETQDLVLNRLSAFAIGAKFFRDRICGDRNQEPSTTAYYNKFSLGRGKNTGVNTGVYRLFSDFIDVNYDNGENGHWGLYPWLNELTQHDHILDLFKFDKKTDLKDVLSYKAKQGNGLMNQLIQPLHPSPASYNNFSSAMNARSSNLSSYSEQDFFKVLHDVSVDIFEKIK